MRITLIHNPKAGPQDQPDADALLRLIRDAGHDVESRDCDDIDHLVDRLDDHSADHFADHFADKATAGTCDLIAISGGDGTVGRVAKRLLGCPVPLTFIPTGTANNLSRSLGLLELSLEQLIAGWSTARILPIDLGVIEGPWGSQHFIEGVGVGLFTRTMLEIDAFNSLAHLTTPQEKIAEALALMGERLRTFPARRMSLTLDGADLSGEYLMVEAMNIRYVGPNLYVAPGCDPGDGLLDVVLVAEKERASLLAHLASWRRGALLAPSLPTYRGAHLQIEWLGSTLHVDDETWPPEGEGEYAVPSTIDIRARKHALRVMIPGPPAAG
jgi:diacylglycerol kinase (ATP)